MVCPRGFVGVEIEEARQDEIQEDTTSMEEKLEAVSAFSELGVIRNSILDYVRSRVKNDRSSEYILLHLIEQFRKETIRLTVDNKI